MLKELKLTTNPLTGRTLDAYTSDPDAKYQLAKFGHAQKAKFRVFGFESETAVLTFTFRFLSSPLFLLFLPHFFSPAGHLVGFVLWEEFLGKLLGS